MNVLCLPHRWQYSAIAATPSRRTMRGAAIGSAQMRELRTGHATTAAALASGPGQVTLVSTIQRVELIRVTLLVASILSRKQFQDEADIGSGQYRNLKGW